MHAVPSLLTEDIVVTSGILVTGEYQNIASVFAVDLHTPLRKQYL